MPGSTWSRPVAGARWAAQTSAASPTASARVASLSWRGRGGDAPQRRSPSNRVEVGGQALRQARRHPAEAVADRRRAAGRQQELGRRAAGRPRRPAPTVRWSVGSNERSESISSPKNSIRIGSGSDGGKTSTMPPRRANSPRPATSVTGTYPRSNSSCRSASWWSRAPSRSSRGRRRQVGRGDRVLEQRLDARDEDPRPGRSAMRRAPRPGRPSRRRRARSARRRGRSAARGPRPRPGRPSHAPSSSATRSPISASRAIQTSRSPSARGRGPPRGSSSRRAGPPRGRRGGRPPRRRRSARPSRSRRAANVPVAASSGGSAERSGRRWPPPLRAAARGRRRPWSRPQAVGGGRRPAGGARPRPRRRPRRRRSRPRASGRARGRGARRSRSRRARRSGGRGRAGRAAGSSGIGQASGSGRRGSGASPSSSGGCRRRPAGRPTSPGAASRVVSAGRSSNMLKRLAALFVPSRAHASTASAAASSSSSRRCCSSGAKRGQDVVDGVAVRLADPDPQPAELLGAELVDDRAQAVVAAGAAALAEAQLAERQREVVGDDQQVGQRRVLAGQHLADGEPGVVHVRQRLDEGQVEAAEAAHDDVGRVALAARPVQPARSASRSRTSQPMLWRVPAYCDPGFPRPTTTFNRPSADSTTGPDPAPGGPAAMVARRTSSRLGEEPSARGRASRPPRPARRGPSRRCGACRGSPAGAARRRATSGRRRSGRRGPSSAWSIARSTETTMSPRCGRRPGGSGKRWPCARGVPARRSVAPGCGGNASGGSSGNDRTSVGPVRARGGPRSARRARASSDRISPIEAGRRRRRPRRAAAAIARASAAPETGADDPVADRQVDPPRPEVERPGHEAGPLARRHRRRPRAATRARRPCSAGRRSAGGTCRAAGRRTPRGSARGRAA